MLSVWNALFLIYWYFVNTLRINQFHIIGEGRSVDKAPRLSISIVIWILSSDTDTICQLNQFNTNSEAAMLSILVGVLVRVLVRVHDRVQRARLQFASGERLGSAGGHTSAPLNKINLLIGNYRKNSERWAKDHKSIAFLLPLVSRKCWFKVYESWYGNIALKHTKVLETHFADYMYWLQRILLALDLFQPHGMMASCINKSGECDKR